MSILKVAGGIRIMDLSAPVIPAAAPVRTQVDPSYRLEQSGNCVVAAIDDLGRPAIFATIADAEAAIAAGDVPVSSEHAEYYHRRGEKWPWRPV